MTIWLNGVPWANETFRFCAADGAVVAHVVTDSSGDASFRAARTITSIMSGGSLFDISLRENAHTSIRFEGGNVVGPAESAMSEDVGDITLDDIDTDEESSYKCPYNSEGYGSTINALKLKTVEGQKISVQRP